MKAKIQRYFRIIAVVLTLVITGLSLLLYFTYDEAISLVKQQFNEQQTLVARQTAIGVEHNVEMLVRELEVLSRMGPIKSMDLGQSRRIMEQAFEYVKTLYVNDIALIDAKGILRLPLMAPHLEGRDFSYREYYGAASALKKSIPTYEFITFKGVDIGAKGLIIAMPVFPRDEQFGGVVLLTIKVDELLKGFIPAQSTDTDFWAIDSHGKILYHPEYNPGTIVEKMPNIDASLETFLENVKAGKPCKADYISPEGIKTVASSHPIRIADETWSMIVATPEAVVSNLLRSFSAKFGFAALVVLLATLSASLITVYLINRSNLQLQREILQRKRAEETLRRRTHDVGERVKELNCLYAISALVEKPGISLEEIFQGTIDLIPASWQYPEFTCARLILEGREWRTNNFQEAIWKQTSDVVVHGDQIGVLEVCYVEEKPESDEGPFLKEERSLINAIAERLERIIEYKQAEEALQKAHEESERRVEERTADLAKAIEHLRQEIKERKRAQEALLESEKKAQGTSMELALGLSEVFEALREISSGDPLVRIPETSELELITKLKHMVNLTAKNLAEIVDLSHEFAIGLAEHFDVLHRVSGGDLAARVSGASQVELLESLKRVTNQMIESVSTEITERKEAEDNVHVLSQELLKVQETERQKLSHDLHDHLAQDLSSLKIGLDTLFYNQVQVSAKIRRRVSELSKMLQGNITAVRDLAYDLRPAGLDQLGLVRTVREHCEEFAANNAVKVDFFAAGIDDLSLHFDTKITLYRLVQESLNNVKKHAEASQVSVRLVASFPSIILRIEDNGKGFDVRERLASAAEKKRMGLSSMEQRVAFLKGEIKIESRPTKGTKISIEIPYEEKG